MSGLNWQRRWDPFRDLQREVGRLFETLEPLQHWRLTRQYPAINLYDAGDHYVLAAQLPGMTPEEVDLSITGETLTIKGDRKRPEGVSHESYRRQERVFGRWTRTILLPD
ncbi:MAG: Hsp20/alpha crystallin family protein, partial [Planctomycetaceae bacterium]|nr:Hsp20/alpha crystallin family protein [Planctomycetaceae bacterium]